MAGNETLLAALTEFAETLTTHYDVADVLDELTSRAATVLDATGAGVSLGDAKGELAFATASSEMVSRIERVQEQSQLGPCWAAYRTQTLVLITDVAEREDWPEYRAVCLEEDIRSVAGIPMVWDGRSFGALNVYREGPRFWTETEIAAAGILANMATSYVAHASQLDEAKRLNEQLQEALDSRVVIEQAKGLLAGERGVTLNEAFESLRRHARSHHASLRAVAEAVVQVGFRP